MSPEHDDRHRLRLCMPNGSSLSSRFANLSRDPRRAASTAQPSMSPAERADLTAAVLAGPAVTARQR